MNKFIFRKPLALLLAVVMLFSSALVNLPAYAIGDPPPTLNLNILEGEELVDVHFGGVSGYKLLIKEHIYIPMGPNWIYSLDGIALSQIHTTTHLQASVNTYQIVGIADLPVDGICLPDKVVANINLTVLPNTAPVISGTLDITEGDVDVDFDWRDYASDAETLDSGLVLTNAPQASIGTLEAVTVNTYKYSHDGSEPDSGTVPYISFTVSDGVHETGLGIVVNVDRENDDPVANEDDEIVNLGDTITVSPLVNDTDEEDENISLKIDQNSIINLTDGLLTDITDVDDVSFKYTPSSLTDVTIQIQYTVIDSEGGTDVGIITIDVNEPEVKQVIARPDTHSMPEKATDESDDTITIDVLENDGYNDDPVDEYNSDDFTILINSSSPELNATEVNDKVEIDPGAGVFGVFTVNYTAYDVLDKHDSTVLTVTIIEEEEVNNGVTAPDLGVTVVEGGSNTVVIPGSNPFSLDSGEDYSFTHADSGTYGSTNISGDEYDITYTHDDSDTTSDSFAYTVSDGVHFATGTVTVTIIEEPDGILNADNDIAVMYDTDGSININVLKNDIYENGLSNVQVYEGTGNLLDANNGDIEVLDSNKIKYTPNSGFSGMDMFEYRLRDGVNDPSRAFVLVDVRKVYTDLPDLKPVNFNVGEGEFVGFNIFDGLNSPNMPRISQFPPSNPPAQFPTIVMENVRSIKMDWAPESGILQLDNKGFLSYQAIDDIGMPMDWYEARYMIEMDNDDIYYGYINITVHAVDQITLMDDFRIAKENTEYQAEPFETKPKTTYYYPIFDNDIYNEPMMWAGVYPFTDAFEPLEAPMHGDVVITPFGAAYTPEVGYVGLDYFRYFVLDNTGWPDVASVLISVEPEVMDPVDLENYFLGTFDDTPVSQEVLSDAIEEVPDYFDTDSLVVTAEYDVSSNPSNGIITVNDGIVTYNPNDDNTQVVLKYTVTDQFGHEATGMITVLVSVDTGIASVILNNWNKIWINQYDHDAFYLLRDDVTYRPSIDASVAQYIELIQYAIDPLTNSVYEGFYDKNLTLNGMALPLSYFYGQFEVTFKMVDTEGLDDQDGPRRVNVNYRPNLSFEPLLNVPEVITPSGTLSILSSQEQVEPYESYERFFGEEFDIEAMLYGYDFEDFDGQPVAIIDGNLPADMELLFYLDGNDDGHPIDEFWQYAIVVREPGLDPMVDEDDTPTVYTIEFRLEDSRGHLSLPTPMIELTVKNNLPEIDVPVFDLAGENLDYITVGQDYSIWFSSTGEDTVLEDDVTYFDVEAEWLPSIGQPYAHTGVTVYIYDPSIEPSGGYSYVGENQAAFDNTVAGRYRFDYLVIDYHGARATDSRFLEVNTIPEIWNDETNPGNLLEEPVPTEEVVIQLGDTYELWTDIMFEDFDLDPMELNYKIMKQGETTPFMEDSFPAGTDLSTILFDTSGPFNPGYYIVSYGVEDVWGERDDIMDSKTILVNTPPEIMIDDPTMIYTVDDVINPLDGVTVIDPEDAAAMALEPDPTPLEESIVVTVYDEITDTDLGEVDINTLGTGVYTIVYTYTDMHGASTSEVKLVFVLLQPMLLLDPETVVMEPEGWFPVFNGLEVNYSELDDLIYQAGFDTYNYYNGYDLVLGAFVEESGVLRELDDLEWVEESIQIIYKLGIDFYLVTNPTVTEEPEVDMPETDIVLEFTRDVTVDDSYMGQIVYLTDFWRYNQTESIEVDSLTFSKSSNYQSFDTFALLIKFNPETGERRLVTAVYMEDHYSIEEQYINFSKECDLDDIAVTKTGEIYGIRSKYFMKLNPESMIFETLFMIPDEVFDFALRNDLVEEDYLEDEEHPFHHEFQSLTVDERGYLVLAIEDTDDEGYTTINEMFASSDDLNYGNYDNALLYFNPNGFDPDELDDDADEISFLSEVALIDWGMTDDGDPIERDPFEGITDLAYNDAYTKIYGIGSYYEREEYSGSDQASIDLESSHSRDGNKDYKLFSLIEVTEPTVDFETTAFVKYFKADYIQDLTYGYMYRGMAVIGSDIYITRYMSECLFDDLVEDGTLVAPLEMTLMETEVIRYTFDSGFVDQNDVEPVDGMFNAAFGAAGMKTEMTLSPPNVDIILYNDEAATSKSATFTLTRMPFESYDEIEWTVDAADATEMTNSNGTFTLTNAVNSDRTLHFDVKALNLVSGNIETLSGTVTVDYRIRPVKEDEPDDPTPRRTTPTTTTVKVSLDTDAVTLDYGETADPEFTSYDFTETVTGTTNKGVSWELSDDTFVTVDENGVITAKADVPLDTGDFTVTLTVRTDVGNATDTAAILFEEQTPLGAIEFFDPYIAGYPDNSFRPTNYVTRAEVASMFAKILNLNTTTLGSQKFMDVPSTHWAYGQVQAMYRSGVFSGYMDVEGTRYFDPEAPISRAEIAQVFTNYWNFLDISVNGGTVTSVPDVDANFWAAPAINRIFNTGIFTGFEDGTFKPNEATLREQIVSMINRLIDRPANEADASKFTDILPTHNHFGDIEAASQTFLKPQGE